MTDHDGMYEHTETALLDLVEGRLRPSDGLSLIGHEAAFKVSAILREAQRLIDAERGHETSKQPVADMASWLQAACKNHERGGATFEHEEGLEPPLPWKVALDIALSLASRHAPGLSAHDLWVIALDTRGAAGLHYESVNSIAQTSKWWSEEPSSPPAPPTVGQSNEP